MATNMQFVGIVTVGLITSAIASAAAFFSLVLVVQFCCATVEAGRLLTVVVRKSARSTQYVLAGDVARGWLLELATSRRGYLPPMFVGAVTIGCLPLLSGSSTWLFLIAVGVLRKNGVSDLLIPWIVMAPVLLSMAYAMASCKLENAALRAKELRLCRRERRWQELRDKRRQQRKKAASSLVI